MPRFSELDTEFVCPFRHGCPYLEGLPTQMVWRRYQEVAGTEDHYEHIIEQLNQKLDQECHRSRELQRENEQLKAQLQALHRRQFKGRHKPDPAAENGLSPRSEKKKRGAPQGHPPWVRPKPERIDRLVEVAAPSLCPDCHSADLTPLPETRPHLQEDIVLEPRVVTTCFMHHLAHCPHCDREVVQPGPGELLGSYIGPAAKATALYLRHQLNVSDRKISQFFEDFFGLKFVPASAYGFERQAVRRGQPLYADLLDKVRSLPVVHADETSWRHDGQPYWVWYAGDPDLAVFLWDAHRSTEAAQKLLGRRFGGVLVADAFASYNGVQPKDRQSCLAHIKRKAKEIDQELALLKGAGADPVARQFCQNIQGWVHEACQAHQQLSRKPWRAPPAQTAARRLKKRLNQLCQTSLHYPKAETLRQRLRGPEQKQLLTCFRYPKVPPTNNQAEQSLRPVVIMRKVIQGTRSEKGLENHSILRSLFETARRQGKKTKDFLVDLFTKNTVEAQAALYRHPLPKIQNRDPPRGGNIHHPSRLG
jgi:transposase